MPAVSKLARTSTVRLAALYLAVFVLSVAVILGNVYYNTAVLVERQIDDTVRAEVQGLAEQYRTRGLQGVLDIVNRRSADPQGGVYLFTNFVGRRLAGNLPSLPAAAVGDQGWIEFAYPIDAREGVRSRTARAFYVELDKGFRLVVGRDVEERRRFNQIIRNSLFWALALTLLLGVGGGWLMSRNFLRRVEKIGTASRAIMAGDLGERMPVTGTGDELDRLSESLNNMLDQIARLMAGMKEVSSNVAHDLRTPLTRLKARAEDALRSDEPAAYRDALEATLAEADRLLVTFNALLSIARAEAGQSREGLVPVDAAELAADMADLYGPMIEDRGGTLATAIAGPAMVRADRQLLAQAIANLLDNALKYGTAAGAAAPAVTLTVARSGADVAITVADRGPGIPEADRERVKERFVRLDESRTDEGSGLGLSLVTSVMTLHGGRLVLAANDPGLRASLILPALEA